MRNLVGRLGLILEVCERYLVKIIVVGVLLLIVVQSLMSYDYVTYGWNLTQQENPVVVSGLEEDYVTLKILTYSSLHKAQILVNGNIVTNFNTNYVTFAVNPGDKIAVDCSFYAYPIKLEINTSEEVELPTSDQVITCTGTTLLGKVSKRY